MLYLSLGTNIGNRKGNLTRAIELLNAAEMEVTRQSSIYETAPRDILDQPWFLNMVLECRTTLFPIPLLDRVMRIERVIGRDRGPSSIRRGPRLIDIDVLLFHNEEIESEHLTVPHPRMFERRFVLEPLLELVPGIRDPLTKKPLREFLKQVLDQEISKL